MEIPPTAKAWSYLGVQYGFLVDPQGQVVQEESPFRAPQVATLPDGEPERIAVSELGEMLTTSTEASITTTGWRSWERQLVS